MESWGPALVAACITALLQPGLTLAIYRVWVKQLLTLLCSMLGEGGQADGCTSGFPSIERMERVIDNQIAGAVWNEGYGSRRVCVCVCLSSQLYFLVPASTVPGSYKIWPLEQIYSMGPFSQSFSYGTPEEITIVMTLWKGSHLMRVTRYYPCSTSSMVPLSCLKKEMC